jgi:tetratricopeptide (TPR) repeat protein
MAAPTYEHPKPKVLCGRSWWICLALVAITFAVFGQTLTHEFINFDDDNYVYENPVVAQGLTGPGLVWAGGVHAENWHPLTWLSHMLDCQIYGLHPGGHHLTNVLLHTATVIALFLVLRRMTGATWRCAFVAAVFAIHPLRVESVAWVAERKDVLSGLFFMLTIGAYVRYVRGPRSAGRYGLVALLFALGLMCKPMLVTLPVVLLLLDRWPLQRTESTGKLLLEKLPLFALSAASCAATLWAQHGVIRSGGSYSLPARLENVAAAGVIYLRQMVWPVNLAVLYPFPAHGIPGAEAAGAAILLIVLSAIVWKARSASPWLLTGWLWYLVMLLPVVGIVQVGNQAHADRYTYLPQIGLYLAISWMAAEWCAKWRVHPAIPAVFGAGLIGNLMLCAWTQTVYWQNSETLWRHTIACTADNELAYYNLGTFYMRNGRLDSAGACYQEAARLEPDYPNVRNNLGSVLVRQGKADEAIVQFQKALQIKPNYATAHHNLGDAFFQAGKVDEAVAENEKTLLIDPGYAEADYSLGDIFLQKGEVDQAIKHLEKALRSKPELAAAQFDLGVALSQKGEWDNAIDHLQKSIRINPAAADAHLYLGNSLLQKGRVDDAIAQFRITLQLNPNHPRALNNLASVLLQRGRVDEAIPFLRRALQIAPDYWQAHSSLGGALLQKGDFAGALQHLQRACQLSPDDPGAQSNLAWLLATAPQASLRDGKMALQLARQANGSAAGKNPLMLHTLAAALAETGQFPQAMQTAQQAIDAARAAGQESLAARFAGELKRYQAGLPLHQ